MRTKSILVALMLVAGGLAATVSPNAANAALPTAVVGIASTPSGAGYWVATADGRVLTYGDAPFKGSMAGLGLNQPVVGMTPTITGQGYWLVAGDGGIFSFGDALFYGSTGNKVLNQPIVGMASTATGKGYWLVAGDGGIFSYGDALFYGSMGAQRLNQPVVGMAASPTGKGYWLVASDGGIFSFGDSLFYGSMGGQPLNQPVTAMSTAPGGKGYRFVAKDGGIFSFGAPFFGRGVGGAPARAIANRPQGDGYWVVYEDGTVQAFGGAQLLPQTNTSLASLTLHTVPFVSTGLTSPTSMTTRSSDDVMYVADRPGQVRAIRGGVLDPTPVLTISGVDVTGERGFLGLAFSLDGSRLYVDYTTTDGVIHIDEYPMTGTPATAGARRQVLTIDHGPATNHNGGDLQTGPDGLLYISVGDGNTGVNGQSLTTPLGKILRIDPRQSGIQPYTIPATNPFAGMGGGVRTEIWDYGLRNPWRISFDRANGDLWIADVGQSAWEEVDHEAAGSGGHNYGWSLMEGTHPYAGGSPPANHTPPVFEYPHTPDCSISGGRVYRGASITALIGAYIYADFCSGRVGAFKLAGSAVSEARSSFMTVNGPVAFAEDKAGELYVLSLSGTIMKIAAG
ncbi:MAG: PQQ-dependent sugar dehydrogenase [Acidimicrobiales bacterium]